MNPRESPTGVGSPRSDSTATDDPQVAGSQDQAPQAPATEEAEASGPEDPELAGLDGSENLARGRLATAPHRIPPSGWKDILLRVYAQLSHDNVAIVAGGVAFFAFLSLFPLLIAAVSVFGIFASRSHVEARIASLMDILPSEVRVLLAEQLQDITASAPDELGWGALAGLAAALWSASSGTNQLLRGIGIAYDEPEQRPFLRQRALAFGLTLALLLGAGLALAVIAAIPVVLRTVALGPVARVVVTLGPWPFLAIGLTGVLIMLYQVGPYRSRPRKRWVSYGAIVATGLWLLASVGLSYYVSTFGDYAETYGALGSVIVLMLWIYLSAFAVLLGAELSAEIEAQVARDTTVGAPKPMGERNAVKADHLGRTFE